MRSSRHLSILRYFHRGGATALALYLLAAPAFAGRQAAATNGHDQQTFASPEEAVEALKTALAAADKGALATLFGPAIGDLASGDPVADKASYERFAKRLARMTHLVKRDEAKYVLFLGAENWPFPFPIVRTGERWRFDGEAGVQDILDRRIGANELTAIRVAHELVRAQREYAEGDRDGDEVLEYAQRFLSAEGQMNGLYWPAAEGEPDSPLGPVAAYAAAEGYSKSNGSPRPFHGYYLRILTRQERSAPGGAYSYIVNGNMIGGFAIVAYPATWGNSGVMTFVVNQQGKVYEKDLGPKTTSLAKAMRAYNPDRTWRLVERE
jgi:hypothetical protein